jgi:hypothetical protein
MNCFNLTLICRTYQGECSSDSREFEGGISHSRAGMFLDTLGNVVKPSNPSGQSTKSKAHLLEGWVKLADAV